MKEMIIILIVIFYMKCKVDTSKMLIIFFSRTGNTEVFCNYIKEYLNIETYRIVPVNEYPSDSNEMSEIAAKERSTNSRPAIINPLKDINITRYNKILLGYPIWNSFLPSIVISLLLKINFTGKKIYPFNTHESSEQGNSIEEIKIYSPGAIVKKGLCLKGSTIRDNEEEQKLKVKNWLKYHFGFEYDFAKVFRLKLKNLIQFIFLF